MTLLAFGGDNDEVVARVREKHEGDVKIVRVLRPGEAASAGAVIDAAGHARRAYGIGDAGALLIIRPDGYIGYFGKPGSWPRLDHFLSSVLAVSLAPGC